MTFTISRGSVNVFLAAVLFILGSFMVLPAYAADEPTITVPNTEFPLDTDNNPMPILVVGSGFDQSKSYSVVVSVAEGEMFFNPSAGSVSTSPGYPNDLASPANLFGFSGTFANIAKILHSTRYNSGENETNVNLKISISETVPGADRLYFNPANGHYYLWVTNAEGVSWHEAKEAAEQETLFGLTGYLVTITSKSENDFISNYTSATNIWIGAGRVDEFDQEQGAIWEWKTGPEAGTDFYNQGSRLAVGGEFNAWAGSEPNGAWRQMTFNEEVCIDISAIDPSSAIEPVELTEPDTTSETESEDFENPAADPDAASESENETLSPAPDDPEPLKSDPAESEPTLSIQEEQCEIQQVQRFRYFESYAVTNWQFSKGLWNDLPGDPARDIGPQLKISNYLVEFGGTEDSASIMKAEKDVELTISSTAEVPAEPDALGEIDEDSGEEDGGGSDSDNENGSGAEDGASGSGKGLLLPTTGASLGLTALLTMLFALAMSATMMRDSFPRMDVVVEIFTKLRRPQPQPLYTGNFHPAWPTI